MPPTADLDGLSHADLKGLVLKLLEDVADLRRTIASSPGKPMSSLPAACAQVLAAPDAHTVGTALDRGAVR